MELKAGYKQTDAGVIPEDWDVAPLASFAKVTSGKRLPLGYFVGDRVTPYPYIRVTDMRPGWVDTRDVKYVPVEAFPPISKYRIFTEDLFISVAGTLGIVGKIPAELDGANLTENANRISAITSDRDYLLHVMLSPIVQDVIESEQTVGAQPKLALIRIRNFSIPLPPTKSEQSAIAEALGDVDALLSGLDKLIAKKRDLKQAAMQQLLTGKTRLPGFVVKAGYKQTEVGVIPEDWDVAPVGREFDVQLGKMLDAEKNIGELKPYLGNRAVQWNQIDVSDLPLMRMTRSDTERFRLRKGDLLVCEGGEVGRAAIWDEPIEECYYQKALHRLRPLRGFDSRLMVEMLHLWSDAGTLDNHVTQTSIAHFPREKFLEVPMPVPPLPEQSAIAEVLSDMDAELKALQAHRDKTQALKQGMMQELLAGKTRLV